MTFFTIRMEINLSPDAKASFKDTLCVMPLQRLTVHITVKYLINLDAPAAKWKMNYTTVTPIDTNHALTECSHPKLVSLFIIATSVLLHKYI